VLLGQASLLASDNSRKLAVSVGTGFCFYNRRTCAYAVYGQKRPVYRPTSVSRIFPKKKCGEARSYGLTTITKVFLRFAIAKVFLLMSGMSGALRSKSPSLRSHPRLSYRGRLSEAKSDCTNDTLRTFFGKYGRVKGPLLSQRQATLPQQRGPLWKSALPAQYGGSTSNHGSLRWLRQTLRGY
jgi:hypothetical protein